jgi:hypothetical protein
VAPVVGVALDALDQLSQLIHTLTFGTTHIAHIWQATDSHAHRVSEWL